ncbi:MAG TPA: cupin domain-containing protein [Candidatus Dormibacteraeota bacterium]|nr:cupin domain-containing protein [Candidatus Dormibacteraeota bacterium]
MSLEVLAWTGAAIDAATLRARLEEEGCGSVFEWSDPAGADYQPHQHDHDESIWIVRGEMTFLAGGRDLRLGAGDRLMLPRGTVHGARAGAQGATYLVGEYPD